ncbi:MAG TPA: hypothetical protein VF483_13060 [Gemmatimonadaceae bacterium]
MIDPRTPDVFSEYAAGLNVETTALLYSMALLPGQHYLVGHSLGGLVARSAYFRSPSSVAGILTIGTPHAGAIVADSIQHLNDYLVSVAGAIADVTAIVGQNIRPTIQQLHDGSLLATLNTTAADMPRGGSAVADAMTESDFMKAYRATTDYVSHVSIYGTIDKRFAWMRVANSAIDGTNDQVPRWASGYTIAMGVLKVCQTMRRVLIPLPSVERRCGRAYNAMATFDTYWQRYTARGGAFDGWIANSTSAYPGTTLSDVLYNWKVQDVDHNSLISAQKGIDAMADRMIARLGMARRQSATPSNTGRGR